MMTYTNSLDNQKLSPSAQKALRQRVIKAYKKGIKRTQIAKTFGMCFKLPKWNIFGSPWNAALTFKKKY